jgi:hypothetical protein
MAGIDRKRLAIATRRLGRSFALDTPERAGEPGVSRWRRTDLVHTWIPLAIALVSVMGAVVAWRASTFSTSAADLDQQATQQLLERREIFAEFRGRIAYDQRLVAEAQDHFKRWFFENDRNTRVTAEGDREWSLAENLYRFMWSSAIVGPDDTGNLGYDAKKALAEMKSGDKDWANVLPAQTSRLADRAQTKVIRLIGVTALFVLALFFLTIAQLARPELRRVFAGVGAFIVTSSLVLYLLIGP